jgi:L-ascorbate metabolism protein UlaG (beta-lactamase superfamily)
MKIQDIELEWLGHASFKIKYKGKNIFIDPWQLKSEDKADIILVTHSHYDHCSFPDIEKIVKDGTLVICTADSQSTINKIQKKIEIVPIEPDKEVSLKDIKIKAVKAYNSNKQFHQKSEFWVGYLIFLGNTVVYHAGDTDVIKEMANIPEETKKLYLIALLPVGGTYTMTAQEAVKAAELIKPALAIPMHFGSGIGTEADGKKFVELCQEKGINAEVLDKTE